MRLAHMHNAKSREHAHTCRKARAIFKLRYKNKNKNGLDGSIDLTILPQTLVTLSVAKNMLGGTLDFSSLHKPLKTLRLQENSFSGPVKLCGIPESLQWLHINDNMMSGSVDFSPIEEMPLSFDLSGNQALYGTLRANADLYALFSGTLIKLSE
ncbi:hypothetical protein XU18_2611 [Perkinsela sp. CCAP 1560/4]|nr:hypothetical protein XU18_2611 [Perkinsela sp. CCAP 1560/4]|eukprot:KNH06590.1 hypothetical protein XU18_2611 [Perkinsela sp. CCAP 1560/4]